jgi:hypothetical protein
MAEHATSAKRDAGEDRDSEVVELKEEILRLRDLLIGKDAEIGMLRGRLAELEEGSARLTIAATRLRARLPGFLRAAAGGLRKLRRPPD